jgi:hypothetical protein
LIFDRDFSYLTSKTMVVRVVKYCTVVGGYDDLRLSAPSHVPAI